MSIGPDLTKSASTLLLDDKDGHIYGIKPDTDTRCHSTSSFYHHDSNKDLNMLSKYSFSVDCLMNSSWNFCAAYLGSVQSQVLKM